MTSRSRFLVVILPVSLLLVPACSRAQQEEKHRKEVWDNYRKAIGADPQENAKAEAARQLQRQYRAAGRCKHTALRASATPDADYATCRAEDSFAPKEVHLAEFRAHYGPELASISKRRRAIRAEVRKAQDAFRAQHGAGPFPADSVARFFDAWQVFCVDSEVY
jgi:hypothetical protein